MKLYGAIASPYVTRVVMLARIKGIDLPLENVPGRFDPLARIPRFQSDRRKFPVWTWMVAASPNRR